MLGRLPELNDAAIKHVGDRDNGQDKNSDLPDRKALPVRLEDGEHLSKRPRPNEFEKLEDGFDAHLQKSDDLINDLVHALSPP